MGHDHPHDHSHSHPHSSAHREAGFRSLFSVFVLSGTFMVAEIVGGLWSGSLALLADSGHMAIDTVAVGLGLFALWIARMPPTPSRTYGYYRAEILGATLNGALLVAVACWIVYEAIQRFSHPRSIDGSWMTIIAVGGLLVNLVGLRLVHRHSENSLSMRSVTLHLIFDAMGSAGAIIAGLLVWRWGWVWADSAVSILLAIFILVGAVKLLLECVDVLLESVPKGVDLEVLRANLSSVVSVTDVHDLHVWTLSTGVIALSAHLRVKEGADHGLILRQSNGLLQGKHGIAHATLQLEPENYSQEDTHRDCQNRG